MIPRILIFALSIFTFSITAADARPVNQTINNCGLSGTFYQEGCKVCKTKRSSDTEGKFFVCRERGGYGTSNLYWHQLGGQPCDPRTFRPQCR